MHHRLAAEEVVDEDAQVVELDLICEYVLNKAAYESIKPRQVKEDITTAIENATKGKKR